VQEPAKAHFLRLPPSRLMFTLRWLTIAARKSRPTRFNRSSPNRPSNPSSGDALIMPFSDSLRSQAAQNHFDP
jgi:hypothetical protein